MTYAFNDPQFGIVLNLTQQDESTHTKTISGINSTMTASLQSAQAELIQTFGSKLAACTTDTLSGTTRTIKEEVNVSE